MRIDFEKLMKDFSADLSKRTGLLTEDSIRYYIFKSLLSQDDTLDNYTLELPYESIIPGKNEKRFPIVLSSDDGLIRKIGERLDQELDLYHDGGEESVCMEIKFHRHSSKVAFPHPDSAGSLFNDMRRLQLIQPSGEKHIRRLFLYATDDEMHNYLSKTKPGEYRETLRNFYTLARGQQMEFVMPKDSPKTFRKTSSKSFSEQFNKQFPDWKSGIRIKTIWTGNNISCASPSLKSGRLFLRLYEII